MFITHTKYAQTAAPVTYATWDPADKTAAITLSDGDLRVQSSGANVAMVRATIAPTSGKWYWELTSGSGLAAGAAMTGIWQKAVTLQTNHRAAGASGTDGGAVYAQDGMWYPAGTGAGASYGSSHSHPVTLKFAWDADARQWWAGIAGGAWFNSGDPAAGTNPAPGSITGDATAMASDDSGTAAINIDWTANFGQSAFIDTVPTGFNPGLYV